MSRLTDLHSKGNILIVDDAPNNLRLLSNMLTQEGYEVRSAISGALALTAAQKDPPDLVLLDINMPEIDGYKVCERLKADTKTADIPVIFLSAYSEALDKVRAFSVGGVDYITKPFQVEEVLARIHNHLTLRQLNMELELAKAEALRALEKEKELNRLRSEFVSMISHDFRTPLTSIQGFSDLLKEAGDSLKSEIKHRYFDKISTNVEYMLHLLDRVLLIGSAELGRVDYNPEPIHLKEFCWELIETLKPRLEEEQQIQMIWQTPLEEACLDKILLKQILLNLLSNALKYSPNGTSVYLRVDCSSKRTVFAIEDKGIGIPKENQHSLFTAFHRCQNVGTIRGTGLGLAVVKTCVDAHKGQIRLVSEEGKGTLVTVMLPNRLPG